MSELIDASTFKKQQIKNGMIYYIPVIVGNLLSFVSLVILTRILSKEDFGLFALAQMYGFFLTGLVNFGLSWTYERNFFQYPNLKDRAALLYSILLFVFVVSLVVAFVTHLLGGPLSRLITGSTAHAHLILLGFCASCVMSFKFYFLTYFKSFNDAKSFVWYTIDENLLGFILSLLLVVVFRLGVAGLFWGELASALVILTALIYRFQKHLPFRFDWAPLKNSLKISYPLTPKILLGVVGGQADKYMINLMSSTGGVGIFSIGQRIANVIFVSMTTIQNVFSPQVFKKMFDLREKGGEAIGRYLTPFAYVSIFVALLISLFAEEVLTLATPPSYHGAINVVIVLSMYYGFLFLGKIIGAQLVFVAKNQYSSLMALISLVVSVALSIPMIIKWGAIGAAWGTLMGGIVSNLIGHAIAQRFYPIKWEYWKIGAIFFILFTSSIGLIFLQHIHAPYPARLILKCAAIILYIALGVNVRVFTRENYLILKTMLLKRTTTLSYQQT